MFRSSLWSILAVVVVLAGCSPQPAPTETTSTKPAVAPTTPDAPSPATAEVPTPAPTEMATAPAAPEQPAQTAPATGKRTFVLQPDSEITWEMGVTGTFGAGTRKGGWAIFDGTVEVDGAAFETAKIDVEVNMASAFSDDAALTKKLNGEEHFFIPAKFPTSTFKSTAIKKTDSGYDVTGDFTIKGVTKSVTFPAIVKIEGDTLTADATFELNRQDYGINYDSAAGDFLIKDMAKMTLKILAKVE